MFVSAWLAGVAATVVVSQAAPAAREPGVRYRIEARLDEATHVLHGRARLAYRNDSPDTLAELYVHLYLNAFRPHSLWARVEERPQYDFGSLRDPDYAYERLHRVTVAGASVVPEYAHAPDSTVARIALPRRLSPGDSVTVDLEWDARLSTLWRRQGRAGRHYDFAQWYPKIAVYDRYGWAAHPLYPQGEFYGEFATYDVTLDLPEDQVVAATGVPVEGDPGWSRGAASGAPVTYLREAYGAVPAAGTGAAGRGAAEPGRKRVRFYAERVHHFAWSADPSFRYEEGRYGDLVLRVLFLPESAREWSGRVVEYSRRAMAWLDTIFGPYPWPQVTVAERLEGGGTEFSMLVMNGSASEGLVVHELGHQYTHGVLANNEWKEGWLDEGFSTFQSRWYFDRRYGPVRGAPRRGYARHRPALTARELDEIEILRMDAFGWSEPIATPSEDFPEFAIYGAMIYMRGSLVLEVLRDRLGEETFRAALREYYRRYALRHVDETAFRTSLEETCRCDLRDFFAQWLHGVGRVDYAVGGVHRRRSDGGWTTVVAVERKGEIRAPVEVLVRGPDGGEARARVAGYAKRESVTLRTPWRPDAVVVDPENAVMDFDRSNNYRSAGWRWFRDPAAVRGFDWPFISERSRERPVETWFPLLWYNDAGGLVLGMRTRSNQMGWLDVRESGFAVAARQADDDFFGAGYHFWQRGRNPPALVRERRQLAYVYGAVEDRWGGTVTVRLDRSPRWGRGPRVFVETGLRLFSADSGAYVPPALWDDGETLELWLGASVRHVVRGDPRLFRIEAALGVAHLETDPFFGERTAGFARGELVAGGRFRIAGPWRVQLRGYAGVLADLEQFDVALPRQRRLVVAGADPYATLWNPFVRSRGSLFRRGDVQYHSPGGPDLRGFDPDLTASAAGTLHLRVGPQLRIGPIDAVRLTSFAEGGVVRFADPAGLGGRSLGLVDAGAGLEIETRILDEVARLRVDLPVYVNRPELAVMRSDDRWAARWVFSFESDL